MASTTTLLALLLVATAALLPGSSSDDIHLEHRHRARHGHGGTRPAPPPPPPPPHHPPVPPCCMLCRNCTQCSLEPDGPFRSASPATPSPPPALGGGLECVTPLAGLMVCGTFLTGGQAAETPSPQSECCTGLRAFINGASAAADGDRTLRCLCPVILGDVNRFLSKPVNPVRLMFLPIACGVLLPPNLLGLCFTAAAAGHQTPELLAPDDIKPPSAALPSP